jgi:subtilisin family serine protease
MSERRLVDRLKGAGSQLRFILVPKESPLEEIDRELPRAVASRKVIAASRTFDRLTVPFEKEFRKIGLKDAGELSSRSRADDLHRLPGVFEKLSRIQALAVRVKDMEEASRIFDAVNDRYRIVLDVRSECEVGSSVPDEKSKRAIRNGYPADSGVRYGMNKDVDGTGVLVGVLDTGIDADHKEFKKRRVPLRSARVDRQSRLGAERSRL